jgi:ribosome-binding factor A
MTLKQERMSERILIVLSELLQREISDPRLQHITVTEVKVDPEIMFADVYVSALGDESREEEVMAGLDRAKGFLRRELGKNITTRNTPELHFHWDMSLARGEQLNQLLDSLDIPPAEPETEADNWDDLDNFDDID